jgi:hypothetical protein
VQLQLGLDQDVVRLFEPSEAGKAAPQHLPGMDPQPLASDRDQLIASQVVPLLQPVEACLQGGGLFGGVHTVCRYL